MGRIISTTGGPWQNAYGNPQENAYGGSGTKGIQAVRGGKSLQKTRKPGPSSDIVNENINQGYGKGQTLKVTKAKTQPKLKVQR